MNEDEATRLFSRAAESLPPMSHVPARRLIDGGKKMRRRQRLLSAGSVAALAALIIGAGALWLPGSSGSAQPPMSTNETNAPDEPVMPPAPKGTRWVVFKDVMVAVPDSWEDQFTACGTATSDAVDFHSDFVECPSPSPGTANEEAFSVLRPLALSSPMGAQWADAQGKTVDLDGTTATRNGGTCDHGTLLVCTGALVVPSLDAVFVVSSPDTAVVKAILDTARLVPGATPEGTTADLLTAPDGTRWVGFNGVMVAVPEGWSINDTTCGGPLSNTVSFDGEADDCPHPGVPGMSMLQAVDSSSPLGRQWKEAEGDAVDIDGELATRVPSLCEESKPPGCYGAILVPDRHAVFTVTGQDIDVVDAILDSATLIPEGYTAVPDVAGMFADEETRETMEDAGLSGEGFECSDGPFDSCLMSTVEATDPVAGSVVPFGTTVRAVDPGADGDAPGTEQEEQVTSCQRLLDSGWSPPPFNDLDVSNDRETGIATITIGDETLVLDIRNDDACARLPEVGSAIKQLQPPVDTQPGEPPNGWTTGIPDDFPLQAGLPEYSEFSIRGPRPGVADIQVESCNETSLDMAAAVETLSVTALGPETQYDRVLGTFSNADAARRMSEKLIDQLASCPEWTNNQYQEVTELETTDLGDEGWVASTRSFDNGNPSPGLDVLHVTRLRNAVLVVRGHTEGGSGPDEGAATIKEQTKQAEPLVAAMCQYAATPCQPR